MAAAPTISDKSCAEAASGSVILCMQGNFVWMEAALTDLKSIVV